MFSWLLTKAVQLIDSFGFRGLFQGYRREVQRIRVSVRIAPGKDFDNFREALTLFKLGRGVQ